MPIHIPGSVQPHGVLLAIDDDGIVSAASENADEWFPAVSGGRFLGLMLRHVIGQRASDVVLSLTTQASTGRVDAISLPTEPPLEATMFRSGHLTVVEFEHPGTTHAVSISNLAAMRLQRTNSIESTADTLVQIIKELTGFDRVMVYRFDQDWSAEVIAEACRPELQTFLGFYFPPTDVPAEARAAHHRNWIRLVADVHAQPVMVVPEHIDDGRPLDLTDSAICNVSATELECFANMGVAASMSVSLIVDERLWGLVACHHYAGPHHVPPASRELAAHLGQVASQRVADAEAADERDRELRLAELNNLLATVMAGEELRTLDDLLDLHGDAVMRLGAASGVWIRMAGRTASFGAVPPEPRIAELLRAAPRRQSLEPVAFDHLAGVVPSFVDIADVAAGAMIAPLTADVEEVVVWFRGERNLAWSGHPHDDAGSAEQPGPRPTPWPGFNLWRESMRGRSHAWAPAKLAAAARFGLAISAERIRRERHLLSVASDLQEVMLPGSLPTLAGMRLDAVYLPSGRGEVGGDWYDSLSLSPRHTMFALGDVAGHGLAAAGAMAQVRNALRAYLIDDPSVAGALVKLDTFVTTTMPGELVSMVVIVIDHEAATLEIGRAGHLPPVRVEAGRAEIVDHPANRLLGVFAGPYDTVEEPLVSGQSWVLYSDGLVEQRKTDWDERTGALLRWASELIGTGAPRPARKLVDRMVPGEHDDVTVVVVSVDAVEARGPIDPTPAAIR